MGLKKFGKGLVKKAKKMIGLQKVKAPSALEDRAQAAQQMIRGAAKRQAGAGQISYTEERLV